MKAAVIEQKRTINIKDIDEPKIDVNDVLIRVKTCGISASDVKIYNGTHPRAKYPIIPGHEICGDVLAVGKGVKDLNEGDKVIVEPLVTCKVCYACVTGRYNQCQEIKKLGEDLSGGLAEYISVNSSSIYEKDDSLSYEESVLIEPLAWAVHTVRRAGIGIDDNVVILGGGAEGLLMIQVAKMTGAVVVMVERDQERLHLSADLGADYVISPNSGDLVEMIMALTGGRGVSHVIDCSGTQESISQALDIVCKGGTVTLMLWTGNQVDPVGLTKIAMNEIKLIGSANYCHDFPTALNLASSRCVNLNSIISNEFELNQVRDAFEKLSEGNEIIKAVVKIPEPSVI